jgi:hypothetical protein
MIPYSLVNMLFFCDQESARLGIYARMELQKKMKQLFIFVLRIAS